MGFWIDTDRMVICWESGERDVAYALARREGFALATGGIGLNEPHQHRDGFWERRIIYATARRNRDRANAKARNERGEACEG